MPIEFDPSTSSYYQVAYSGQVVERPAPEEPPPPPEEQAAPPPEQAEPVTDLPPAYEDSSLQQENTGYPGGLTAGSIVDEVV